MGGKKDAMRGGVSVGLQSDWSSAKNSQVSLYLLHFRITWAFFFFCHSFKYQLMPVFYYY